MQMQTQLAIIHAEYRPAMHLPITCGYVATAVSAKCMYAPANKPILSIVHLFAAYVCCICCRGGVSLTHGCNYQLQHVHFHLLSRHVLTCRLQQALECHLKLAAMVFGRAPYIRVSAGVCA